MIRLYDDFFTTTEDIHSFLGIAHNMNNEIKEYLNNVFLPKRIAKKIAAKVILSKNTYNQTHYKPFQK